jgi:hypothetical protein
MAIIPANTFKVWRDGEVVTALEYMQELEILRTAINANGLDVSVLKNAALGVLKGVQNGDEFPPNPVPGDLYYRTDEGLLYVLNATSNWTALPLSSELAAHTASTDNPHKVSASQIGTYTKTEIDSKFPVKTESVFGSGQRIETVNVLFFTNGGSNNSTATATFSRSFSQIPVVIPGSVVEPVSYIDTIGHPHIIATKTGFTVKIQTDGSGNLGTLGSPKNAIISFLAVGK